MRVKVSRRIPRADLRQPGPPGLEPSHDLQARSPFQLSGILATAPRLDVLPDGSRVRNTSLRPAVVWRLVRAITKLMHTR
jgi:hypothetical protein